MNRSDLKRAVIRLRSLEWLGNRAKENDEAANIAANVLLGVDYSIGDIKEEINKYKNRNSTTPYEIGLQVGMENALKILYKNIDYEDNNTT